MERCLPLAAACFSTAVENERCSTCGTFAEATIPRPHDAISVTSAEQPWAWPPISLQGCQPRHPLERHLSSGQPVPSTPAATWHPAEGSNRKHHVYCPQSALQKKHPNSGARQGPLSRTCIRESEQARRRGQLGRVHEDHSVSHLA